MRPKPIPISQNMESLSRKRSLFYSMSMPFNFMTMRVRNSKKIGFCCWVSVTNRISFSSAIASATMERLFVSSPREKRLNQRGNSMEVTEMKAEYDLSKMKSRKNPYASKLKKPVTIRLSEDVVAYFKQMSEESGVPYQSLINLYLRDCVAQHRTLDISWNKKLA